MANRPSKESLAEMPEIDFTKVKTLGRGLRARSGRKLVLPLAGVRSAVGKTQVDVATAAEMDQATVSRLEQRDDALVSTLRRYVRALGGELEVAVVFPKTGQRIRLDL